MRLSKVELLSLFPRATAILNEHLLSDREGEEFSVSIDSREEHERSLFFALQGARVDGHAFLAQAIGSGASVLILDEQKRFYFDRLPEELQKKSVVFLVENVELSLYEAARLYRSWFAIPIIGITGSMGKTTTKEILVHILKQVGKNVCYSHKNQNNLLGAALSIFRLAAEHDLAVFELGINAPGEMDELVDLVKPTDGLMTTVAHAHTEGLTSLQGIVNEKIKMFLGMASGAKMMVGASIIPFLKQEEVENFISFGKNVKASIWYESIDVQRIKIHGLASEPVVWQHDEFHEGRLYNRLQAAAYATMLGVESGQALREAFAWNGSIGRFEVKKTSFGIIIDDACNANPESMIGALKALNNFPVKSKTLKIAVLGSMYELGEQSLEGHKEVVEATKHLTLITHVIYVGDLFRFVNDETNKKKQLFYVSTVQGAEEELIQLVRNCKAIVLLKASKSVGLSALAQHLALQ